MKTKSDLALQYFKEAQDALVLQASDMSLGTVSSMVNAQSIDVSPRYQRRERWDLSRQRSLIESFLINIPVPPVYLFEEDYGSYTVIDGKQRIHAIHNFMTGQLQLAGMSRFQVLDGCYFANMPSGIQNAFLVRPYLRVVTLLRQSHEELKYEVFRRLNEGGEPLNAQEIRNVVFRGAINDLLYDLSENEFLLKQMKIKSKKEPAYRQMQNVEVVLRYFVLRQSWKKFSGSFRESMDNFMAAHRRADKKEINELRNEFDRAINGCHAVFGNAAFRRPADTGWRDQFLIGMYDAQMVAISDCTDREISSAASRNYDIMRTLRNEFAENPIFEAAIREATNTPSRIRERINRLLELLK